VDLGREFARLEPRVGYRWRRAPAPGEARLAARLGRVLGRTRKESFTSGCAPLERVLWDSVHDLCKRVSRVR
jgi:hypothetical protein